MYRQLDAGKLLETIDRLVARIEQRFPEAGLTRVARELRGVAAESAARAVDIRRPIIWLRACIGLLIAGALALLLFGIHQIRIRTVADFEPLELIQAAESAIGSLVFAGAGIFFLVTLETRVKRRRALYALHELHAMAHIIDMHQLSKDPELLLFEGSDPGQRRHVLTLPDLGRYLDYCSEMLSHIAKVAALYVQGFPDGEALSAVDDLEDLTTGLSRKIWQKITILEQVAVRAADLRRSRHGGSIEL